MKNPKVLVVGINPWIDNTGINTLINFFENWDKDSLAHIYTRAGLPNTKICDRFFRISEPKVLKSVIKRGIKTGEVVENGSVVNKEMAEENNLYKKKRGEFMSFCRELVWKLGKWKTKELDEFLDSFKPDIILHTGDVTDEVKVGRVDIILKPNDFAKAESVKKKLQQYTGLEIYIQAKGGSK